jgi:hypothetical protein
LRLNNLAHQAYPKDCWTKIDSFLKSRHGEGLRDELEEVQNESTRWNQGNIEEI